VIATGRRPVDEQGARIDRWPLVSAIVVTYRGHLYVDRCLSSLAAGSCGPAEILVVDNGSGDGTAEAVAERFPDVRLLANGRNLGYGGACNLAAAASHSEYLAIVNQDVESTPGWIDALVTALEHHPEAGLATPTVLIRDESRVNACGNAPHYTGITVCRGYGRAIGGSAHPQEVPAISGAAFVVRRSVYEALGGFDAAFFLYFEDTDLSLRAQLAGWRCLWVPTAVVLHDFAPHFSAEKVFLLERNRWMSWLKLFRWRTLALLGAVNSRLM
jgi:GT2 family glycosyltransferase